ncbi:MAG: hypothetical protein KJI71_04305 [Patescibacteria group bacterium]|nr:hypothetical protein [Patescibacteria group bacterium]
MKAKKILSALLLVSFSFLLLPTMILAQPIECCQLGRTIEFEGITYNEGIWVGEAACGGATDMGASCPPTGNQDGCVTPKWGLICFVNTVNTVVDFSSFILITVVVFLVLIGGFTIATAGGNPENVNKGRNYIMYAMLGLAVVLLSRAIPGIVEAFVG